MSLIALKDTLTIQDINLDKKELLFDINPKRLESYWYRERAEHPSDNHYKIFCD